MSLEDTCWTILVPLRNKDRDAKATTEKLAKLQQRRPGGCLDGHKKTKSREMKEREQSKYSALFLQAQYFMTVHNNNSSSRILIDGLTFVD